MRNYILMFLLGIVSVLLLACGEAATAVPTADTTPTEVPAPTAVPTVAPTESEADTEEPAAMEGEYSPVLLAIAAERANKAGAIFVGDLSMLVGPAPTPDEGDADGNVPLDALEKHLYVYESD